MPAPLLPVLLTRPEAASLPLARDLRARGAEVVVSPLLRIVPVAALPQLAAGLIFTSPNGVAAYRGLGGPPGLPVWCVGPRTGAEAQAAGLDLRGTAPDAATLAQAIPADAPPLLHLRGAVQRGDLASDLRARGLAAQDAVIYRQDALPLSAPAVRVLSRPTLVPLYSPRTAGLLVAGCPAGLLANLRPLALSAAVARALPVSAPIAKTPDGAAMYRAILSAVFGSTVEGPPRSH
ncbi:uroporphyrinogen-III synthase [Jannaschia sp. M317]|uniref:uroporphyrinogen-III synthase n=1 Tax=Jannaschia sp. M317 TaxID=2867011 RepID=UPI0021A28770|nr:uroporphyrinogen-III synthase [Jannaschia sp. M317]UWQ17773.1 uroporphyrinogen-III synthase [Jannaschia sp. M317]